MVYATSYSTPRDILKYIPWAWFTTADVNLGHWAEAVFARFLCYEVTVSSSTHTPFRGVLFGRKSLHTVPLYFKN